MKFRCKVYLQKRRVVGVGLRLQQGMVEHLGISKFWALLLPVPQRSKAIWIMDGTWHVVRAAAAGVWSSRWRKAITITVKNCSLATRRGRNQFSLSPFSLSLLPFLLSLLSSHRFSATAPVGQNKTEDRAVGVWGDDAAHRSERPAAQSKV